jgi:hypothetical protein
MLRGIARIASFADTSDSQRSPAFWRRNKHFAGQIFPVPIVPVSVAWSCQHLRQPKTMGLLQSFVATLILLQSGVLAHGSLGYAQEKPLVGDASFDYAEACPDYAKYSTSPQYV